MEVEIGRYLSTEHMLRDPTNHCVPIMDYFRDPIDPEIEYIVMPNLRPFNDQAFRVIGEVVDFVSQVLEVSMLWCYAIYIPLTLSGYELHASPPGRPWV
jgi:hypothetical protein